MIKFENTQVVGWEPAIRGMRNPMNSWEKSDSNIMICDYMDSCESCPHNGSYICDNDIVAEIPVIGPNDHKLMMSLAKAGRDHSKYRRMIVVYVDITAPLYWFKEFDTYKVGTVANSCSTMHKIAEKEFTVDDFSVEHLDCCIPITPGIFSTSIMSLIIETLEFWRREYNKCCEKLKNKELTEAERNCILARKKRAWHQMIQLLPTSYNQRRTIMFNYEVLANIYKSRKNHKLDEWSVGFMDWIKSLPYSEIITLEEKDG